MTDDGLAGPYERTVLDYGAPLTKTETPRLAPKFQAVARGIDDLHQARTNRAVAWRATAASIIVGSLLAGIGWAFSHFFH